ncbi:FAD-dependent monooxygenase [Actinomycetospora endophytica]|uniref:FAD-dependent monooxygenase n=1 Tax=Actinomycetospora endophytica TaxID=2291215 RepID=A0ABS8PFG7_9PSEU|nr:FAD-dependent monooxygenase [Actinomycetospora endophytica]MCD2196983.1 FAD-dependent monooxygenase [Actinomycetospora endophytica]
MTSVLISGASIAGPVLAFWLRRAGVEVTVVEIAPTVRGGGYPIDLRGVAVDVVERMGLLEPVEAARTGTRALTFVTERGRTIASLGPATLLGEQSIRAVELPRGDLTTVLWEATRDDVEYVFDDRITALDDRDDGVHVTFRRGTPRVFDLVIGADGLHSGVRALTFGPEAPVRRDLGACYAAFSVPNVFGLDREAVMMNLPGRSVTLYAVRDQPVTALFSFAGPTPTLDHRDTEGQRLLVEHVFGGVGWWAPELLVRMRRAEDFYFDTVSQIRMPSWTRGRVGLIGDAAHAPSFRSGQGTSIATVGAYVLAAEIAAHPDDVRAALPAYEARMRGFATQNQDLATSGAFITSPRTGSQLAGRNALLRSVPLLERLHLPAPGGAIARAATALALPEEPRPAVAAVAP